MSLYSSNPQFHRLRFSVPNYALPYNAPLRPQLYQKPDGSYGAVYNTVGGSFGNCNGNPMPPYDFINPVGAMAYSQTYPVMGYGPAEICSYIERRRPYRCCP